MRYSWWRCRICCGLIASATLAGCSFQPLYTQPALSVPSLLVPEESNTTATADTALDVNLSTLIVDAQLREIVRMALANNRDVSVAVANIEAARALYRGERAALLPEVAATSAVTRSDASRTNGGTGLSPGGGGSFNAINGAAGLRNRYAAQVGVSAFELDLFGRVRSLRDAALNRYLASEEAARSARLTLVGEMVEAWLTYAADRDFLRVAAQTRMNANANVDLTRERLRRGIVSRTDLRQAEGLAASAAADVARLTTAIAQDVNALDQLSGRRVDRSVLPSGIADALSAIGKVEPGVSSSVLLGRPDVMAAEYAIRAANGDVGAARAALFPTVSLTSVAGLVSNSLLSLATGGELSFSIGADVRYSVFRAGARRAGVAYATAMREAALARYAGLLQTAFKEAADALARRATLTDETAAREAGVKAQADAYLLANARYKGGLDTFLANLDAQRALYAAKQDLISIQLVAGINRVGLYKALGGEREAALPVG